MKGPQFKDFTKDIFRTTLLAWQASKGMVVINIILQFVLAALPIISLYFIKRLIELMVSGNKVPFEQVSPVIISFCIAQFLIAVANQFSTYINTLQQQKISDHVAELVLNKAIHVDLEYYVNHYYHDYLLLAHQQSQYRIPQLVTNMNGLLLNSFSLLFLIGFFFTLQWFYALLFILLSIPLAGIKWYYSYQLYRLEKRFIPVEREAGYLHQVLTGISFAKEVRVFGFADEFIRKFKAIRSSVYEGKKALNIKLTRYSLLTQVLEAVVMVTIFISLAKNAWDGQITLGVFIIYIQGFQRLQSASKNFLQSFVQIFQQRLFLKDLFTFFDIVPAAADTTTPFPVINNGLEVKNLSFTYPATTRPVLNNVSISCKPGKIIAIVGENGSGKSTLVKLLARLYELQSGTINIDGISAQTISNGSFRANTFFLFQDFEKYFLTVNDNITLAGRNGKQQTDTKLAATLAGADSYINTLPKNYDTRLGRIFDKSEELSGGQWQKLALARMFYKNAGMIVLDEPTSAIDAIAEHELFKNLKEHAEGKVVILISHTLYNLKIADNIYVMKDGKIEEEGSFDSLIDQNGIFKKMFDNQKI
ncbi:MAG: transporter ATP-binding protein [Flavipsychrobacter sp.]|nr:transporter ATP-binding protein [Flavipsychrobacter sp.]